MKKILTILFCVVSCFTLLKAQTVTNGSVTGAPIGNNQILNATGWTKCYFSPDLCDVTFRSYVAGSSVPAIASPDGGTWLGLASNAECAQTTITGLTVGQTYTLCFYGACFGTAASFNGPMTAPRICVGATCQNYSIPMAANTWTQYSMNFTANASTMVLSCTHPSTVSAYVSLDGFRVGPVGFCGVTGAIGDTICNGDQAMIHANGGSAYNWYQSGNPGVSLGTNDTLFVSPSTTTTYVVTIDGTNDTVDVVVHPTYSSNVNTTICQGDSVLLEGAYQTTSGIYNDTLYTVNGCDSIIITNLTVNPVPVNNVNASICQSDSIFLAGAYQNTSGVYNDTISAGAANGCDSIVVTTLTVNQFVTGNANAQICQGDSILLGGVYQTLAGNYNDTIFGGSASGCDSIVITNLSIIPTSMGSANARICDNDSILIGNMYYSSAGVYPYTIPNGSASGCDSIVNVTLTVDYAFSNHQDLIICQGDSALVGGQYVSKFGFNQVSYQSINGCDSTYTATISFIPQYDFYLPEDTTLCMGQTFILSPYINSTYYNLMWENGSTNQYREVDTSGTFIMTYSHKSCDHQGSDEINVLFENCDFFIYVPNTFTPNKDGLNDGFAPVIYGEFTDYSFRIFDRWGEVIFESSTHGESWKGTYMNELVKTDVYVWKLIVKPKKSKEITQIGKVTILK